MRIPIIYCILFIMTGMPVLAEEEIVDELSVPLSHPNQPASVELGLLNGSITVSGYSGQTVEIVAKTHMKKIDGDPQEKKGREGMFRISAVSTEMEVEEDQNHVEIDVNSINKTVDIELKVPFQTSLNLGTHHNGQIRVENVKGEFEIENHHGSISLIDISGSVVAHTHHGGIKVVFKAIDENKPMSFSAYHKDIDVTFPASLKADVKIKTERGEIFSDFKIVKSEMPVKQIEEKSGKEEGKYRVRIDRAYYGKINGGGPEFQFNNYHGDILIRKGE